MASIALNTFRARTRGKAPKKFSFQGVGNPKARKVSDADGNPIVENAEGKQVTYKYEKNKETGKYSVESADGITLDDKNNLVLPDGLSFVEVDDADVEAIAPKEDASQDEKAAFVREILSNLFAGDYRTFGIVALKGYNDIARDKAAEPFRTVQTKEDDLAEIVDLLKTHKVLTSDADETNWRRKVSMGYDAMTEKAEQTSAGKLDFAYSTALGKKVAAHRPAKAA
jgi:hypothetical protein